MFVLGCVLIVVAPVTAPLPGPGATMLAAAGLSLVLKTSPWAQRRYIRFKARFPKAGAWCDWGMRRASYRRRVELAKVRAAEGG